MGLSKAYIPPAVTTFRKSARSHLILASSNTTRSQGVVRLMFPSSSAPILRPHARVYRNDSLALVRTADESSVNSDGKIKSIVGLVDATAANIVCSALSDSRI